MAGDEIVIREATEKDAAAIHAMVVALARHIGKAEFVTSSVDSIRSKGFGAKPAFEALIADRGGEAVGLALFFYEFSTWRGQRGVFVQDLYVAEGMRGTGLGRRLLAELGARGMKGGADYIKLSVDSMNRSAAAFYERLGFEERKSERIFVLADGAFKSLAGE